MKKIILISLFSFITSHSVGLGIIQLGMNAGHFSDRTDKIDTLVMHYTVSNMARTLMHFFGNQSVVSANYIISKEGYIFKNIKKKFTAHHAGLSYWNGKSKINSNSLGIEHVNPGYKVYEEQPTGIIIKGSYKEWYPFNEEEISSSIKLSKHIIEKYNIRPNQFVLGYIARKSIDKGCIDMLKIFSKLFIYLLVKIFNYLFKSFNKCFGIVFSHSFSKLFKFFN